MILNFLGSVLFFSLYMLWLFVCFVLALVGFLIPVRAEVLDSKYVLESDTICKALFHKNKLTQSEYDFETTQVAEHYSDLIFRGYGFIVAPIIWTIKKFNFIDSAVLFFVYRWMNVHHRLFQTSSHTANKNQFRSPPFRPPPYFHIWLTAVCVKIAKGTGKSLFLFDRVAGVKP